MCIVSMVMDHFDPLFPRPDGTPIVPRIEPFDTTPVGGAPPVTMPFQWPTAQTMRAELDELRKLIGEFKELYAAAKKIDVVTKQPDCEDPEKIKLLSRVSDLETRIDQLERERQAHSMLKTISKKPKKRAKRRTSNSRA